MQRLDQYCTALLSSRTKAQEAIALGCVKLNGKVIYKNATLLKDDDTIQIDTQHLLLGRAGYKLRSFIDTLEERQIWAKGYLAHKRVCDIGSSTGGFTQVLLSHNVLQVVCIDVGKNQLHAHIRDDKRVEVFEECDIRDFKDDRIFDLVVCDVSFISLYKLLESFKALQSREYIWLFKPQFEVGKNAKRDKKGVLKDKNLGLKALEKFCQYVQNDFHIIHTQKSALLGKEGNEEFFIYVKR